MSDWLNRSAVGQQRHKRSGQKEFVDDAALAAPPLADMRVQSVAIEAWCSTPKMRIGSAALEAWVTPGTVNERVSQAALEAWVVNTGSMRAGSVSIEAWVPAPVAQLSLSLGPSLAPGVNFGSNRVDRSFSPHTSPPQFALVATNHPVFPALLGLQYPVTKELIYGAVTQQVASGKRFSVLEWTDPVWLYTLSFEFLRQSETFLEQQALLGLFFQSLGQENTFYYDDPDDDTATNVVFADAISIGPPLSTQTVFQLLRNFYDNSGNVIASAPVYAPQEISIRVGTAADGSGGTPTSAWTLGANGRVIFDTSPYISGAPGSHNYLAWSGTFYQLCRFEDDQQDFDQLWHQMFELKQLKFKTTKPEGANSGG